MEFRYPCLLLVLVSLLFDGCMTASDWPEGYYGLPMAKTGCPVGATFDWKTGWIFQDTENDDPSNSKSASFHIEGQVLPSSVNRSFCMKTSIPGDQHRPLWPSGTYCIYHGTTTTCPFGFTQGAVAWEDENNSNKNDRKGFLPKSNFPPSGTKIYFCCRNDGSKTIPMDLPVVSPFYLFARSSSKCQQVRWAVATSEWIYYDTEDNPNYHYDSVTLPAPYVTNGGNAYSGHKIHYCYYKSCQNVFNTSTGSFQSPRYPGNYPNNQQCSWHISVKASQAILVHFLDFSLSDVDQLIFYDGTSDTGRRVATLHGRSKSSDKTRDYLSASSDFFVVFRSNRAGSSSGFSATYKAIDTSTVSPTALTSPIGTTTISTTTKAKTTIATTTNKLQLETTQPTDRPDVTISSRGSKTTPPTDEPALPNRNSSKSYDLLNKSCMQESQASLIAVAIVIPLICVIAVIVMAAFLVFRLRNVREKSSDVSVRYSPESVNNPSYLRSDIVIDTRSPSNEYEDSKGDLYHEIESSRQATDNPLYQSADTEDKRVYASFA